MWSSDMCMEDIAIAGLCHSSTRRVIANNPITLPANVDRIAVRLSGFASASCAIMFTDTESNRALGIGYAVAETVRTGTGDAIGSVTISLDYRTDGPLVMGSIRVSSVSRDALLTEIFMSPELSRAVRKKREAILRGN